MERLSHGGKREFQIGAHARGLQTSPAAAAFEGGFVVCWTDNPNPPCEMGGPDVRAKIFNSDGEPVGRDFVVNEETIDHQLSPRMASLRDGRFVLLWQDFSGRGGDPCSGGIKAKLLDKGGAAVCKEFLVNAETADRQIKPAVSPLSSGGFVVAWEDHGAAGGWNSEGRIKVRTFDAAGIPAGDEYLVSAREKGCQSAPAVAGLSMDEFVVVWAETNGKHEDEERLRAKVFGASGRTERAAFAVAGRSSKTVGVVAVLPTKEGLVVAWTNRKEGGLGSRIEMRSFSARGVPLSEVIVVTESDHEIAPQLVALEDGFVVVWFEHAIEGGQFKSGFRLKHIHPDHLACQHEAVLEFPINSRTVCFATTAVDTNRVALVWEANDSAGVLKSVLWTWRSSNSAKGTLSQELHEEMN